MAIYNASIMLPIPQLKPGWILAHACAGYIIGVAFASFAITTWGYIVLGITVLLMVLWLSGVRRSEGVSLRFPLLFKEGARGWSRAGMALAAIILLTAAVGWYRYQLVQPDAASVIYTTESYREVVGTIVRIQETETSLRYTLTNLAVDKENRTDRVLVTAPLFATLHVGDRVQVFCELKKPEAFEGFAYDRFLAAKDIVARCSTREIPFFLEEDSRWSIQILRATAYLHDAVVHAIDRILPDPHAQLLAGLLIGDDAFSQTWNERFLTTGTSHIVAASGSNVAIVVSLLLSALFALAIPRKRATWIVLGGILLFVLLAGMEAAVTRAGVMASLVVLARMIGRKTTMRNIVLLTVATMLVIEPRLLRDDVGFQLSVLSTIGLLFWAKPFAERLAFIPEKLGLREAFATTCAATLATMPVTLFSLGQFSFVAPFVNLLVLPLIPYAMLTGSITTVLGIFLTTIARYLAVVPWILLEAMLFVIREMSQIPYASVKADLFVKLLFVGIGAGVIFIYFRFRRAKEHKPVQAAQKISSTISTNVLAFGGVVIIVALLAFHAYRSGTWISRDTVSVWVFNIGQGDGIFIDTPGKDVVIDGGPSTIMPEKIGAVLPWFDRSIDAMMVTHPHADHLIGLIPTYQSYAVTSVYDPQQGYTSSEFFVWQKMIPERIFPRAGDVIELAPDTRLRILWPAAPYGNDRIDDPNDGSIVALLETPHGSMLLTGDAGVEQEDFFLDALPDRVDVLKVGHHGSRTSTSSELLEKIRPTVVIISVAEENSYGLPDEDVLDRLTFFGATTYRTDLQGDIRVLFSEKGIEVKDFKL